MTDQSSRDVLPIPDSPYEGDPPMDARDPAATFPPIEPLRPPAGAPNVLVVLLDDVGFAASSAFGGPCATPTAERLAAGGLKFNRFHTTALCAPTRQALGRWCRARPAERTRGGEADIVEQNDEDVRCTGRGEKRLDRRERRLRILGVQRQLSLVRPGRNRQDVT